MMAESVIGRAMVDAEASMVVPKNEQAARELSALGYRPLNLERFPWRCAVAREIHVDNPWVPDGVRCVLVEGHEGPHRGEVTWS